MFLTGGSYSIIDLKFLEMLNYYLYTYVPTPDTEWIQLRPCRPSVSTTTIDRHRCDYIFMSVVGTYIIWKKNEVLKSWWPESQFLLLILTVCNNNRIRYRKHDTKNIFPLCDGPYYIIICPLSMYAERKNRSTKSQKRKCPFLRLCSAATLCSLSEAIIYLCFFPLQNYTAPIEFPLLQLYVIISQ